MKNLLFILIIIFYPTFLNAQKFTLSGTIIDAKTGKALQDATVFIVDAKMGSSSNSNGEFIIKNLWGGKHLIEISHVGFATISEYIDIEDDTKKDFGLVESVVENDVVVVTGTNGATILKKMPFQIDVLKKNELLQTSSNNIIESIGKKPGVSMLSTGPSISKPVIRGLGYNRVVIIHDGVKQEGQQWGDEHGIEIDEASVSKIEILKGPASLIYGSDAMAGVINIITNIPIPDHTIAGNILSGYQTNNNLRAFHATIAGNENGFNWNAYSSTKQAADYQNKYDGRVFNSKFRENNFGGYAGYNNHWGYSHLLISSFNLTTGLIEGERDDDGYFLKPLPGGDDTRAIESDFKSTSPSIPFQKIHHLKIATDNSIRIKKNRLFFNVGFQKNLRKEFGNIDDLYEKSLAFNLNTITYTTQYHLHQIKDGEISIGLNGMRQQNSNEGIGQIIPDYHLLDMGGYIFSRKTIKKINLSGGIRFDNRVLNTENLLDGIEIKNNGFKKSFSNFSGSIGLSAPLSQNYNVKLNVARGFRAPSISELASNGAHEGTNRYEYGNIDLKNETSLQIDAGISFNTGHFSFDIATYYNRFDHFIFYRKLLAQAGGDSTINIDGENLVAFQFDQQKAILSGVEATLDFHPHPLDWLHIENTFSLVNGRLIKPIEGSKFLPFMPAPRLQTEIKASFKKIKNNIQNFYIKFELDNTFSQHKIFTGFNTETTTSGYILFNGGFGGNLTNKKDQTIFSLFFTASNITDVAYQNHLSRLKYTPENLATGRTGIFNMGRNFSIKINIPFNFKIKSS